MRSQRVYMIAFAATVATIATTLILLFAAFPRSIHGFTFLGARDLVKVDLSNVFVFLLNSTRTDGNYSLACESGYTMSRVDGVEAIFACNYTRVNITLPLDPSKYGKRVKLDVSPVNISDFRQVWEDVLVARFTIPKGVTQGVLREPEPIDNPYYFNVRFGLPVCFSVSTDVDDFTIWIRLRVFINGIEFYEKKIEHRGFDVIWSGRSYEVCIDPVIGAMELISENVFDIMNYELLKALDGGKDVTITFKITLHMSMQQAANARGWVYVAAGLPYVVFMSQSFATQLFSKEILT